jgi:hypothetical protein
MLMDAIARAAEMGNSSLATVPNVVLITVLPVIAPTAVLNLLVDVPAVHQMMKPVLVVDVPEDAVGAVDAQVVVCNTSSRKVEAG